MPPAVTIQAAYSLTGRAAASEQGGLAWPGCGSSRHFDADIAVVRQKQDTGNSLRVVPR